MSTATRHEAASHDHAAVEAELVADASSLVTPPTVCVKLFELVRSNRASADEIGEVVATDPNLSARLLRIVNSSFYGFPSQIETVSRAVAILGVSDLYNLALAISAVRTFSTAGDGLATIEDFWRHSILVALLARHLAKQLRLRDPDRLFVAGLLHDVGITVLYSQRPDVAARLRAAMDAGEQALFAAEREHLGFSHASLGARLLEQWELPGTIGAAVRFHHEPGAATTGRLEAAIVHLADAVADATDAPAHPDHPGPAPQVDQSLAEALGTSPGALDLDAALDAARGDLAETMRSLTAGR